MISNQAAIPPPPAAAGLSPSPAGHILFVDDEPVMRRNVWLALTRAGYSVALAGDGTEAWNTLSAEDFDLLITDSQMPGLSGEELVIRLRSHGMALPVIVAAARTEFFLRPENRYLKVAGVLSKPFLLRDLVAAVRWALIAESLNASPHQTPEK